MKKKWILLAEGLLLAVLFVLSFGGSDIVFEADHQQLYRVEETGGIVSKDFALNPGVYRIIVESDIANGGIGRDHFSCDQGQPGNFVCGYRA